MGQTSSRGVGTQGRRRGGVDLLRIDNPVPIPSIPEDSSPTPEIVVDAVAFSSRKSDNARGGRFD
jgi:hypothetical protein